MKISIVYVTCKNKVEAIKIAKHLVNKKLAACTNIIYPSVSIYRWKGKIEEAKEAILIAKTLSSLSSQVIEEIKKIHSYDTAEIISWDVNKTSSEVYSWIEAELGKNFR